MHSIFIGLAVCNAVELHELALLPVIEVLFKRGFVDEYIYRSMDKIAEDVAAPPRPEDKREFMFICDRYQQIVTTWAGYTDEEEEESGDDLDWDDDEGRYLDYKELLTQDLNAFDTQIGDLYDLLIRVSLGNHVQCDLL